MNQTEPDWKQQAQVLWSQKPCGSVDGEQGNLEYFRAVERQRYESEVPWLKPFVGFDAYAGQRVLEIGFGQGTDLCEFAKGGAICSGLDITPHHFELAKTNLALQGLHADLFLEDAAHMHFDDGVFDVVYSIGVLHHTPETQACVDEAFRVLKPGGSLIIGLYHKWSAYHLFGLLLNKGLLQGGLAKIGYDGVLATIESGADGKDIKPYVKLFSRRGMRRLLHRFHPVQIDIKHLESSHFGRFEPQLSERALRSLEPRLGWYVFGKAIKPSETSLT